MLNIVTIKAVYSGLFPQPAANTPRKGRRGVASTIFNFNALARRRTNSPAEQEPNKKDTRANKNTKERPENINGLTLSTSVENVNPVESPMAINSPMEEEPYKPATDEEHQYENVDGDVHLRCTNLGFFSHRGVICIGQMKT